MHDDDKIRTLLTSAGMLMEDASARMILGEGSLEDRVAALRHLTRDLTVIAEAAEVIQRRKGVTR